MKKLLTLIILIVAVSAGLSAVDLGLGFLYDFGLAKEADLPDEYGNILENSFLTFRIDVPLDTQLGLLITTGVMFESPEDPEPAADFNEIIHWNGQFGPVYHFFGYERRLDPYGSIGVGCAGSVYVSDGLYFTSYEEEESYWLENTKLELYTYASAGVNLRLGSRFLIGAELQAKLYGFNPTPLADYNFHDYSMSIHCAVRL